MRILVFAYACEPDEGSEPGAGWAWARIAAGLGTTTVITRANNRDAIEAGVSAIPPHERPAFVYVDLPPWARRWKRGRRGLFLYYVLWQHAARREALRLQQEEPFDLVWHLTLANVWLGSGAARLDAPLVFGPVGGGMTVPIRAFPVLGLRGGVEEVLRRTVRGAARLANPMARRTWRRARLILVQNDETRTWLPRRYRSKTVVLPNVVVEAQERRPTSGRSVAVYAGRLLPWKGIALAIDAIADLPGWTLQICGAGRDVDRLARRASRLGVEDRVHFRGELPRDELLRLVRDEATVFVFPSMREEGGWAVGEALALGVPVVCLARGGPAVLGGLVVTDDDPRTMARSFATAIEEAARAPRPDGTALTSSARLARAEELFRGAGLLPGNVDRPLVHDPMDGTTKG